MIAVKNLELIEIGPPFAPYGNSTNNFIFYHLKMTKINNLGFISLQYLQTTNSRCVYNKLCLFLLTINPLFENQYKSCSYIHQLICPLTTFNSFVGFSEALCAFVCLLLGQLTDTDRQTSTDFNQYGANKALICSAKAHSTLTHLQI
jgi:hypothetical protein